MKKIVFLLIDIVLLTLGIVYSIFKYRKVEGLGWNQENFQKTLLIASGPSLKIDIQKCMFLIILPQPNILKKLSQSIMFLLTEFFGVRTQLKILKKTMRNYLNVLMTLNGT